MNTFYIKCQVYLVVINSVIKLNSDSPGSIFCVLIIYVNEQHDAWQTTGTRVRLRPASTVHSLRQYIYLLLVLHMCFQVNHHRRKKEAYASLYSHLLSAESSNGTTAKRGQKKRLVGDVSVGIGII